MKEIFKRSVRTSKKTQSINLIKINRLMLFKEIYMHTTSSENHMKHINTLCEQNAEFLLIKLVEHELLLPVGFKVNKILTH
jgi:hypothetical protein